MIFKKLSQIATIAVLTMTVVHAVDLKTDVASCNCASQAFQVANRCFCDAEAKKLYDCLHVKSPNWPLVADNGSNADCPNPVTDAQGFEKCIQNQMPKFDPNSDKILAECLASTQAKETTASASNGNVQVSNNNNATTSGTSTPNPATETTPAKSSATQWILSTGSQMIMLSLVFLTL